MTKLRNVTRLFRSHLPGVGGAPISPALPSGMVTNGPRVPHRGDICDYLTTCVRSIRVMYLEAVTFLD